MRAFARRRQMSPSFLSEVLQGKKAVSPIRAEQLRTMLMNPDEMTETVETTKIDIAIEINPIR